MCKTIQQKAKFRADPDRVYRLLTSAPAHARLTGQKARIRNRVGGAFSTRNGSVSGINVELVPGVRLVQAWRRSDFPAGVFSMVTFRLTATEGGGTELRLTHRGVPKELIPQIEKEWRTLYWDKIRREPRR